MAKFLRVIFNLLLMCYIAAALALFVPPLVGVTTAVTVEGTDGNQELGSVNYALRTPLKTLQAGDEIVVTGENSVNVYSVQSADTENSVVVTSDNTEIAVRTYVHKLMLTVPYLGYIAVGMQTMEGMIILGAVAGTLLVLCILTAIWCRKRKVKRMQEDEDDLNDEDENEFFQNLADQKRESDAREEERFRKRQESISDSAVVRTDQPALDEDYEEFPAVQDPDLQKTRVVAEAVPEALDEADEDADMEAFAAPEELPEASEDIPEAQVKDSEQPEEQILETEAEEMEVERAVETGNIPGVQAALEAALDTQQIQRHVRRAEAVREPAVEAEPLVAEEIELAMPVHTVDEYLQKAYAAGQDPKVRKDELTGVTYVDYSECI